MPGKDALATVNPALGEKGSPIAKIFGRLDAFVFLFFTSYDLGYYKGVNDVSHSLDVDKLLNLRRGRVDRTLANQMSVGCKIF